MALVFAIALVAGWLVGADGAPAAPVIPAAKPDQPAAAPLPEVVPSTATPPGTTVERGVVVVRPSVKPEPPPAPPRAAAEPDPMPLTPWQRQCLAARQDGAAAYRLGRRYLFGMGVRRNRQTGVAWMRIAARLGEPRARRVISLVPARWGRFRPSCGLGGGRARRFVTPPKHLVEMVNQIAPRYRVDPKLVLAVMQVESAFQTDAVSPKGAAGLMQLIPATARRFGVANVFSPEENIHGGTRYLRWLLAYFRGNVTLALAGYNAGENAVDRHRGVPPYTETMNYVSLVRRLYRTVTHPYDPSVTVPSPHIPAQTASR